MSAKNKIRKGKREIQASPPAEWRAAPRPNYSTNVDLKFPYSEYPRDNPYEYYSVRLGATQGATRILDFWGEGRIVSGRLTTGFTAAYNVNHQFQLVSNGRDSGKKIPNRIPTRDYDTVSVAKYVPNASFDIITLMGAPITDATATEIARIISGDSHSLVVIYGISESDPQVATLERHLDPRELVLSPLYVLPSPLDQINMKALAFRPASDVVAQATSYFLTANMDYCAEVLGSLKRSSKSQGCAGRALATFFAQDNVKNSHLIFALGYEFDKTVDGQGVMNGYMNANVVKIVQSNYSSIKIQSNHGTAAYLCTDGKVTSGSWQWAFFGTSKYIDDRPTYKGGEKFTLVPIASKTQFQIKSSFGTTSYLCTNGSVPANSWQWAFFGTSTYLDSATYKDGQYFYLVPVSGGEQFKVQATFGNSSFLCTNGKVPSGSWQWAFFGTSSYLSPSYTGGEIFTLVIT